jgi:Transposase DDE domain
MALGLVKGEGFPVDASVLEANASRYHGKARDELDWSDKQRQTRAVVEYLAALDTAAEPDPNRKEPKVIWPSDPSSTWTAKANKRVQFGYGLNYLIDIDNAVIVDVEATPARTYDEVAATRIMLDRTEACFDLKPKRLAADTAYGTSKFLGWLVKEKQITPHIPVWERPKREDGKFSTSDFRRARRRSVYICPNGKQLRTSGTVHSDGRQRYRARRGGDLAGAQRQTPVMQRAAFRVPRSKPTSGLECGFGTGGRAHRLSPLRAAGPACLRGACPRHALINVWVTAFHVSLRLGGRFESVPCV